jgi:hypothetical protein
MLSNTERETLHPGKGVGRMGSVLRTKDDSVQISVKIVPSAKGPLRQVKMYESGIGWTHTFYDERHNIVAISAAHMERDAWKSAWKALEHKGYGSPNLKVYLGDHDY